MLRHGTDGCSGRPGPRLRVDAERNRQHVLEAAREVFGELGYGASVEHVARRARVGVGTVYRRFSSKDALVVHVAEREAARLAEQARRALSGEETAWSALSGFVHASVVSGAGRLLPPHLLRADPEDGAQPEDAGRSGQEDSAELVAALGELVRRARSAGELRPGVTVSDVLLVIAAAAQPLPDEREPTSDRLLGILLDGLRGCPSGEAPPGS